MTHILVLKVIINQCGTSSNKDISSRPIWPRRVAEQLMRKRHSGEAEPLRPTNRATRPLLGQRIGQGQIGQRRLRGTLVHSPYNNYSDNDPCSDTGRSRSMIWPYGNEWATSPLPQEAPTCGRPQSGMAKAIGLH